MIIAGTNIAPSEMMYIVLVQFMTSGPYWSAIEVTRNKSKAESTYAEYLERSDSRKVVLIESFIPLTKAEENETRETSTPA